MLYVLPIQAGHSPIGVRQADNVLKCGDGTETILIRQPLLVLCRMQDVIH